MTGANIDDLLNAGNVTWGWFEGGFDHPSQTHIGANGQPKADYIPHHEPFQYYPQTANPMHKAPTGVIGKTDQANHQYDSSLRPTIREENLELIFPSVLCLTGIKVDFRSDHACR